jgi:hypothetical protein
VNDRLLGFLLFLPVPTVLWLFTRQPIGLFASLGLGVLVMLTHRSYARAFALARAQQRCLWCGGPATNQPAIGIEEPLGHTSWCTCTPEHARALERVLTWAATRRRLLLSGILGALGAFLVAAVLAGLGRPAWLQVADAVALLQVGVAVTVLPLGWLSGLARSPASPTGRLPFPIHIQALIGTLFVLWLFRLIGLWWLIAGLGHLARRLGG